MRKRVLRQAGALTLAALMAASMAGCSSSSEDTTAHADTSAAEAAEDGAEAEAADSTEAGSEAADSGEPVTIRLVHYMGEQAKRDALDEILAAFNEAYPNITVDVEVLSSSSYLATYKNYIAAGDAPDIMFGKPQTMTEFVEGGYFMDLTGQQ